MIFLGGRNCIFNLSSPRLRHCYVHSVLQTMTTFEKEEKYQKEREIYAQVFKEFQSVAVNYLILFTLFDNFQHTQSCTVSAQTDIYEINVRVTEIEIYNI